MPAMISRYQKKISGPILDRIDLHLDVPAVKVEKLTTDRDELKGENSAVVQKRVQESRNVQSKRFAQTNIFANAEMNMRDIEQFCPLNNQSLTLLRQAVSQMGLSARSYYRIIRIARTIADLACSKEIVIEHIAEALQYRPKRG